MPSDILSTDVLGCLSPDRVLEIFLERAGSGGDQQVLAAATRGITELLGDRALCVLLEETPHVAFSTQARQRPTSAIDLDRYPELQAAVAERDVVAVEDVRTDARLDAVRANLPPDLAATIAIPLVLPDRCLGAVLVQSSRRRLWEPDALGTARLIARFTALFLNRRASEGIVSAPAPDTSTAPTTISPDVLKNSRILVVDDDDDASAALVDILSMEGYRVERASDGTEGVQRALEFVPDVVLLDVNLPGMSGFEAAARLRDFALTRTVPILFLSGIDRLPMQVRGADLERVDFMVKPFSVDELLTRIHQAVVQSQREKHLQHAADRDELTGVGNLRCLRRRLKLERSQFDRYGHPMSIAMIDVDKLKKINDEHGHLIGSDILRGIAEVLTNQARDSDLVVRYGGDEFVVLLPHTGLADAESFASRVLTELAQLEVQGVHVTLSVGLAAITDRGSSESNEDLLRRADVAAYESKKRGGNCFSASPG